MNKKTEALFQAIDKYDIIAIDKLIKDGVDVNACWKGYTTLTYLVEVMGGDDRCDGCCQDDCYYKVEEVAKLLVEAGADVNAKLNDWPLLLEAAKFGDINLVKLFLEHGANVSETNRLGETALIIAINYSRNYDIAKLLIANGIDVNKGDHDGATPLMEASLNDLIDVVDLLIKAHADVNARRAGGFTALMEACSDYLFPGRDSVELVTKLIEAGADVNAVNEYGETALSYAMKSKSPGVIEVLLKHGAKLGIYHEKSSNKIAKQR
jgi:ankyrin repeat protein